MVYGVRVLYHNFSARSAEAVQPPGRQPQIAGTMFSQVSEGLLRKASVYTVRLLYHEKKRETTGRFTLLTV